MSLDVDPIEVLKEDLKDESIEIQLDAVHALSTIASAVGQERTGELYETLTKYCFPVEVQYAKSPEAYSNTEALAAKEEVLAAIAEELTPEMIEFAGGSKPTAKFILPLLEKLAMVEETVIRQAAVDSLNQMMQHLDLEDLKNTVLEILKHLAEAEWFTSRVSASALTAKLYKLLKYEESRRSLLEIHKRLCTDEMPMVKHNAFKNLVELIEEMNSTTLVLAYAKPLMQQLSNELMESMRCCLVDITKKVAQKTADEKVQEIVPQFVKTAVEDDSWRVRKHLAINLPQICKHLTKPIINNEIIPLYVQLLKDSEPQVRKETILCLGEMILTSEGSAFIKPLIDGGIIQQLSSDSVQEVREALADQISCLGSHLEQNEAKEKLLPTLKKLAADDSPLTRLNLCKKLASVAKILGIEVFEQQVLPLLKEVSIDPKWRVRNSIVHNIAAIAEQMGHVKFTKSRLKDILIQSMKDPAATVRQTAADQIYQLHIQFKFEWIQNNLLDNMKTLYKVSGNYLHRTIPLKVVKLMAANLTQQQVKAHFTEMLLDAMKDPICNVRFNAAKVIQAVYPVADSESQASFKECLQKAASSDSDIDVIYFSKKALEINKC